MFIVKEMQIQTTMRYYYVRISQRQYLTFWAIYFFVVETVIRFVKMFSSISDLYLHARHVAAPVSISSIEKIILKECKIL